MIGIDILNFLLKDNLLFVHAFSNIKRSYFKKTAHQIIYDHIKEYYDKYSIKPDIDSIEISIKSQMTHNAGINKLNNEIIEAINEIRNKDLNVILDQKKQIVEEWVINSASENVILKSAELLAKKTDNAHIKIRSMIEEVSKISFDDDIGVCFTDWRRKIESSRNENYKKFPFRNKELNKVTYFGFESKSLNVIIAGAGVGKSALKISLACDYARAGFNVLYVTMELGAEKVMNRIDSNLLKYNMNLLKELRNDQAKYLERHGETLGDITKIGQIVTKKFPVGTTNMNDITTYYEKLRMKTDFHPEIIFIDYIGNMSPKRGKSDNMYLDGKIISEEMRYFSEIYDLSVVSSNQINRKGYNDRITLATMGESKGVGDTADFVISLRPSPKEENMPNKMYLEVLKNRYSAFVNYNFSLLTVDNQFRFMDDTGEYKVGGNSDSIFETNNNSQNSNIFVGNNSKINFGNSR